MHYLCEIKLPIMRFVMWSVMTLQTSVLRREFTINNTDAASAQCAVCLLTSLLPSRPNPAGRW